MSILKTVSDIMGYASIACWLGAQFPQVLENIRNQSTEGLALPFLASWAFGDLSNLIGCFLTNQLLFQKILASYFCFVDFTLVGQYVYYWHSEPASISYGQRRAHTSTSTIRRMSMDHGAPRYRTLSAVAANVAATAALAAQQDEQANRRYNSRNRRWRRSTDQLAEGSGSHTLEEADESALAALADSFHSEGGRATRRKHVSWSRERGSVGGNITVTRSAFFAPPQATPGEVPGPFGRGRSLQRDGGPDTEGWVRSRTTSESGNKTSSRASRKGAGMVFLGFWALFGIGQLAVNRSDLSPGGRSGVGKVLSAGAIVSPESMETASTSVFIRDPSPDAIPLVFYATNTEDPAPGHHHPESDDALRQRIIGRIFAWLCATLYLTSRLPQIWKNFVRKSVEGLSMYMFTFAFFGNCFYVASVVFSPEFNARPPASTAFIRESIPYLIGSGGTLLFDITIVTQSFIYTPKLHYRGRRSSVRSRMAEEETGLLSGEVLVSGSAGPFSGKSKASPSSAQPTA